MTIKSTATYFIRIDTYWQNSPDRFVGPFESREAGQAAIDAAFEIENNNVWMAGNNCGDVRYGIRVYPDILTKTEARKAGMKHYNYGDHSSNIIGTTIPGNTSELHEAEEFLYAY